MRFAAALLLAVALVGCESADPEGQEVSSNVEVSVERMTRFDGCTLYRITGINDRVYVTRCGGATTTQYNYEVCHPCGKAATCCQTRKTVAEAEVIP